MAATIVLGTQWGDEGKGKVVDLLAADADLVVRYHGGNNAGHTLVVNGEKTILNLVPAGVLHPGKVCVLGPGMVIDPEILVREVDALKARGYLADDRWLRLSEQAHVILPYHRALDRARERMREAGAIGTTGRGIGPAYEDKMARSGVRVGDLFEQGDLRDTLARSLREKNEILPLLGERPVAVDEILAVIDGYRTRLAPFVTDTGAEVRAAIAAGKRVLLEGAQGMLLDVDHGTYPYVTSSNCVAGAASAGAGIPPKAITRVIGITKAYTTRVGGGPFPTELTDALGERLRADGDEYGATTGRPRRCGWFDAVVVRHAIALSGVDGLAVTKLDVLTGLDPVRLCVGYELDGRRLSLPPATQRGWRDARPIYEDHPGWREPLGRCRSLDDLPANARRYLDALTRAVGAPMVLLSIGAGREQTIALGPTLAA
jgi:adenylosuccinate synthase